MNWTLGSSSKQILVSKLLTWIVAAQLASVVVTGTFLYVRVSYYQDSGVLSYLSGRASDQPPAPVAPLRVGVHTFGDFLLPFEQSLVPNPWTDYPRRPQPYPAALVTIFKFLTILPYPTALSLFLIASIVSMLVPILFATRALPSSIKIAACCALVFMTGPFVMVVDRGNAQGLIVVPLFAFAYAWRSKKWPLAAGALIIASIIKLYPIVLVVVLLAERKYRAAAVTIVGTVAISLILFSAYPGSIGHTLAGFVGALKSFSAPDTLGMVRSNFSMVGMLANGTSSLAGIGSPFLATLGRAPWVAGGAYGLLVSVLLFAARLPFVVRLSLALTLLSLVIPVSYGYSLCFVFVIVGEIVREAINEWAGGEASTIDVRVAVPLTIAVVSTLWPNPFPLSNGLSSFATILVPASWTVLALVCALKLLYDGVRGTPKLSSEGAGPTRGF